MILLRLAFLRILFLTGIVSSFCPDECNKLGFSCCETSLDDKKCCPYINGVCCASRDTCCPQGSTCMADGQFCEYSTGFEVALHLFDGNKLKSIATTLESSKDGRKICPDRSSSCPDGSTCCAMAGGQWGCCDGPDSVCCEDKMHCCPGGTKCNVTHGTCDPPQTPSRLDVISLPRLGDSRRIVESVGVARLSYSGVPCDATLECPLETTCCRNTTGQFGCCPMPNAVCCSDGTHCCPQGTRCDLKAQRCELAGLDQLGPIQSSLGQSEVHNRQLCPDGSSVCQEEQTCCKLSDGSWGCCPIPNATCCSDGTHCCPSGFRCDLTAEKCVKNEIVIPQPPVEITCPNSAFRCQIHTTCCPLPNDEWACCPFEKAVCCSDMMHCCPENTTCDVAGQQCVKSSTHRLPFTAIGDSNICPSGLVSCPGGTCCKNAFGLDACCPHPDAVCCESGHCCPKGTTCDDTRQGCIPDRVSIPWYEKLPAQRHTETSKSPSATRCPDHSYCLSNETCCPVAFGRFGCCPFANATCCADRRHCCPNGTHCISGGYCVSSSTITSQTSETTVSAQRMVPMTSHPVRGSHLPQVSQELGETSYATFCGGCEHDWLCCPDAAGMPNRMCCPSPGSICCADGQHCCPSNTVCLANGKCASRAQHTTTSSTAAVLSPRELWNQRPFHSASIAQFDDLPASEAHRARVNVLFLLSDYYEEHAGQHSVCPDRQRFCGPKEKCCSSNRHGYVCVPKESTCCYPEFDTWCPSGYYCSQGQTCKRLHQLV